MYMYSKSFPSHKIYKAVFRDRDVEDFVREDTETRRWYVSRPSRDVSAETTYLVVDTN